MSDRLLTFANTHEAADLVAAPGDVVVLEPWWTPAPGTARPMTAARPVVQAILERIDLQADSLARLDAWAEEAGLPRLFLLDEVAWWDRVRMAVRWDLQELMLWRHVLAAVAPAGRYDRIVVPGDRPALASAGRALGFDVEIRPIVADAEPVSPVAIAVRIARGVRRRAARIYRRVRPRPRPGDVRAGILGDRFEALTASPGVLSITWAGAFQVLETEGRRRVADPYLALVLDRLVAEGCPVTTVVMGPSHRREADWAAIEDDPRMLPTSIVRERWHRPEDDALDSEPLASAFMDAPCPPLEVDGCDLGPLLRESVRGYVGKWLDDQRRWTRCAERFLAELRPRGLFIDREGTRISWIAAAQRLGIPVTSIQHGMIYPGNPDFCRPRHPGLVRPDRTCVFGPYERDILVTQGGYAPDEVVVTGSPRTDLDAVLTRDRAADRESVRRELRVAQGDRLLVVSVAHNTMGEFHSAGMIARVLGGPLPGVHVVIKLHPQDRAASGYPELFRGLASAGGYEPPTVSVVRDLDLYRLLGAADAHLGQSSTVLTDAVVAGLPNMIDVGQAHTDVIGYVAARVAVGVRSVDDVRTFMGHPRPPAPADRAAFMDAHFRTGDAIGLIADVIRAAMTGDGMGPDPTR